MKMEIIKLRNLIEYKAFYHKKILKEKQKKLGENYFKMIYDD